MSRIICIKLPAVFRPLFRLLMHRKKRKRIDRTQTYEKITKF